MSESPNLDVLRAIAVCLVLIAHVVEAIFGIGHFAASIGRAGVLFFFVHTCTVLMFSLERNPSPKAFYLRRFFRIYPLSIATVLFVILFRFPLANWPHEVFHVTHFQVVTNFLLVQNLFHTQSVIGVLWSLPLEIQMYVVLPLLFAFYRVRIEWLWLASCIVAKISHFEIGSPNFLTYVPCFLPGILAYRHSKYARRYMPAWLWPILIFSLVLVTLIPKMSAEWLACLILGFAIPRFREFPTARIAHLIAKYSYGIYLSHAFGIYLAFTTLSYLPLFAKLTIVATSVPLFSALCFHAIEDPFIKFGKSFFANSANKEDVGATRVTLVVN